MRWFVVAISLALLTSCAWKDSKPPLPSDPLDFILGPVTAVPYAEPKAYYTRGHVCLRVGNSRTWYRARGCRWFHGPRRYYRHGSYVWFRFSK